MKEKDLIPALRFKGFTETWEQRKLGELSEIIGGGTPSTQNPEYWDGEINWYAPAEIGESIYVKSSKRRITKLGLEKSSAKLLPVGTVLFTSRAGIGNTAILKTEGTTNQGFQSIVPIIGKLDSYFIYSRTKELKQYAEKVGAGSTFVEVSGKQMSEAPFLFPQVSEQKSIGSFFSTIDHLITLQQRELESLKAAKKTLLSKMFPKKGETIPEVRFPGFTDAWEQRNFSNVIDLTISNNTLSRAALTYEDGVIKNIHYGDILVKFESILDINDDIVPFVTNGKVTEFKTQLLKNGDVILADSAEDETVGKAIEITGISSDSFAVAGLHTIIGRPKIQFAPKFLGYYLNSPSYRKQLIKLMQGIKVLSLSKKNIANTKIVFPKSITEQQSIGSFFSTLDYLITLQQRKLELLKMQKQTLLKLMFPR